MAISTAYDPAYPNDTVLVYGPPGPECWVMIQEEEEQVASIPIKLEVIRKCVLHDLRFGSEGCLKCHPDFKTGMTVINSLKEGTRVFVHGADHRGVVTVPFDGIYAITRHGVFVEGRMNGSAIFEPMRVVEGDGFFMLEPGDPKRATPLEDATTDEIEKAVERVTEPRQYEHPVVWVEPVCTCGFLPDKNCPVDHMGRNKPDPPTPGGDS